ncbi:hypothetical protein PCE1_004213 [Barthelona sp. PCE]
MPKNNRGPQAYQNTRKYKHNKNSKKTKKIMDSPNVGVCPRCRDQIQWRKDFRKYKPLTRPRRCGDCRIPKIRFAYHTICEECATERNVCAKCLKSDPNLIPFQQEEEEQVDLSHLRERERRTVLRKMEQAELEEDETFDVEEILDEMDEKMAIDEANRFGF